MPSYRRGFAFYRNFNFLNPWDLSVEADRSNQVPASSFWEGLRHNEIFRKDINFFVKHGIDASIWLPEKVADKKSKSRKRLEVWERLNQCHPIAKFVVHCFLDKLKKDGQGGKLSFSQTWKQVPTWFRANLMEKCVGAPSLPIPPGLGKSGWSKYFTNLLSSRDESQMLQLRLMLGGELKDRVVVLPSVVCEGKAEVDQVLEQIRPLVKSVHGSKRPYLTRKNWSCYWDYRRNEVRAETSEYEMWAWAQLLKIHDKGKWEEIKKYGEWEHISPALKELVHASPHSAVKSVSKVQGFIKGLYGFTG
jgi:hypothetical protein